MEEILNLVPADVIAGKIQYLLNATYVTRAGVEIPDNSAVEAGVKLWLAYCVGMPVQRSEIVQVNVEGDGALDRMLATPAGRAAMQRKLAEAEMRATVQSNPPSANQAG